MHPVVENISRKIYLLRGQKVMLDVDLAELYAVKTKELNKAVKRNLKRFPADFLFQLSVREFRDLRFQIGTSNNRRGGRRYTPYAFTEQGIAMLSSVLHSNRAAAVNIAIMRAFVKLRHMLASGEEMTRKLFSLEDRLKKHDTRFRNHSQQIRVIFEAIREMISPKNQSIGFKTR